MSYIINKTDAFVSIKLTELGREKLAKGQLNFTYWGIGDSEINYNREEIFEANQNDSTLSGFTKILRPVDQQPDFKSKISSVTTNDVLNTIKSSELNTLKLTINNKAKTRGFFNVSSGITETYSGTTYTRRTGTIQTSEVKGLNTLIIGNGSQYEVGDILLIKLNNNNSGDINLVDTTKALPNFWYRIQNKLTTNSLHDTIELDRPTPNYANNNGTTNYIIYEGGNVEDSFGFNEKTQYWNSDTLSFNSDCKISCSDLPVWNMNNVWCENPIGLTGGTVNPTITLNYEDYNRFGSNNYIGQKYPFLGYDCMSDNDTQTEDNCGLPGQSVIDGTKKSLSILHYTNNTISNFYGEFFFIEKGKELNLTIPNIMYHRRNQDTEKGVDMGMKFVSDVSVKYSGINKTEYYDLMEDPTLVSKSKVVGKVYPQFKTIIFDDDEIVTAMSYKSNRNWTLPELSAELISSNLGLSGGTLPVNKTMFMTYSIGSDDNSGVGNSLPCQYYTKITNNTSSTKDIKFKLSNINFLSYMRKTEKIGYDGLGFNGKNLKVMYQIVDNNTDRPKSDQWKVTDFTSNMITTNNGETIDPLLLEKQDGSITNFLIDKSKYDAAQVFSLNDVLKLPLISEPNKLQFGDEKFFYGNLDTYIGATIYKTLFNLNISGDEFTKTTNITRSDSATNPPDLKISEVGIYDSDKKLIMVGKLSKPVKLSSGKTVMIELGMDF